jgi:hypothetical protein
MQSLTTENTDERGRWAPGNPGRPLGSRNTLAARVLDTFLKDFEAHGAPALVAVREKSPIDYWRIATQLLPQQVLVNAFVQNDPSPLSDIDPATKRQIAARILEQLEQERAKVIEASADDLQTTAISQEVPEPQR